jgi:hypothetical protein
LIIFEELLHAICDVFDRERLSVFVGGAEAGGFEPFEQFVGAFGVHGVVAADRDMG